jgi:hypothetical protein
MPFFMAELCIIENSKPKIYYLWLKFIQVQA